MDSTILWIFIILGIWAIVFYYWLLYYDSRR
jgi:hypothetical protein